MTSPQVPRPAAEWGEDLPSEEERAVLRQYLHILPDRWRAVLLARWRTPTPTYTSLGPQFGNVTGKRIGQLYRGALADLRHEAIRDGTLRDARWE